MRRTTLLLVILCAAGAAPSLAQSPNTATLVVFVVDQTGAVVPDARITVLNVATGATRDAGSGADGSTTLAALQVSGEYTVTVARSGFNTEHVRGVILRAGETASVRVKLVASGGQSEVTVYGTAEE